MISIIIVNYNTGKLLFNALDSIRRSLACEYEVIVADNASQDESVSLCSSFWSDRRFILLRTGANLGFSRANNMAAGISSGEILHFLNPDTEITSAMESDYEKAVAEPSYVYVNPLINADGSHENDMMPIPSLRDIFFWNFRRKKARFWYKGASVIISRGNFEKLGGWCEDYFLYAEDLDFFYRLWLASIPIRSLSSEIYHLGGGSSSNRWNALEREIVVQKSNRLFFRKYFSSFEYFLVKLYFLLHNLIKRPSSVPFYIKAWIRSSYRR